MQKWEYMVTANLWSEETNSFYRYEDENYSQPVSILLGKGSIESVAGWALAADGL